MGAFPNMQAEGQQGRGRWARALVIVLLLGVAAFVLGFWPISLRYDEGWFLRGEIEGTATPLVLFAASDAVPPSAVALDASWPGAGGEKGAVRVAGLRLPLELRELPRGFAPRALLLGGTAGLGEGSAQAGRLLHAGGTKIGEFRVVEAILKTGGTRALADALRSTLDRFGALGPVVYVLAFAVGSVLAFPSSVLTFAAAMAFGFWEGLALVVAGMNAGALAAFLVARYLARGFVARHLPPALRRLDTRLAESGLRTVLVLRLLPVVPFLAVNYACAVSRIRLRDFALGTLVGGLPVTILWVYAGSSLTTFSWSDPKSWIPLSALLVLLAIPWIARRRRSSRNASASP